MGLSIEVQQLDEKLSDLESQKQTLEKLLKESFDRYEKVRLSELQKAKNQIFEEVGAYYESLVESLQNKVKDLGL